MNDGKFFECLNYIHSEFFPELEATMDGFVKALVTFEEKCEYFIEDFM